MMVIFLPLLILSSRVFAQDNFLYLHLVDDSGLDPSVATVWVGGYTQLYDDGRCGVLQSDGTFQVPSIQNKVGTRGNCENKTCYYYEFDFFKVSDISQIRLDEPPSGTNIGNQRLYFVISKDKPTPLHTALTTDPSGQWEWTLYSSNPLTTEGLDDFGNSLMAPGPYD